MMNKIVLYGPYHRCLSVLLFRPWSPLPAPQISPSSAPTRFTPFPNWLACLPVWLHQWVSCHFSCYKWQKPIWITLAKLEEVLFIDAYNQTTGMARAQVGLRIKCNQKRGKPTTAIGKVCYFWFLLPFQHQLRSSHEPASSTWWRTRLSIVFKLHHFIILFIYIYIYRHTHTHILNLIILFLKLCIYTYF